MDGSKKERKKEKRREDAENEIKQSWAKNIEIKTCTKIKSTYYVKWAWKCGTCTYATSPIHVRTKNRFVSLLLWCVTIWLSHCVSRFVPSIGNQNTYSMNGLSIYVHFHRLWLGAFVWFIYFRFSLGMSSAFGVFVAISLLLYLLALLFSLFLFWPRTWYVFFSRFIISFYFILFG